MKRDWAACRDGTDAASHAERSVYTGDGREKTRRHQLAVRSACPREREKDPPHPWFPAVKGTDSRFECALVEQMGVLCRRT